MSKASIKRHIDETQGTIYEHPLPWRVSTVESPDTGPWYEILDAEGFEVCVQYDDSPLTAQLIVDRVNGGEFK
jgi:hypothetical protein